MPTGPSGTPRWGSSTRTVSGVPISRSSTGCPTWCATLSSRTRRSPRSSRGHSRARSSTTSTRSTCSPSTKTAGARNCSSPSDHGPRPLPEVWLEVGEELEGDDLEQEVDALHHDHAHAVVVQLDRSLAHLVHVVRIAGVRPDRDPVLLAQRHGAIDILPQLLVVEVGLVAAGDDA
ncbi:MAG: DUF6907 domain-containing protein [Candidatus Dormibacteria bacterium]